MKFIKRIVLVMGALMGSGLLPLLAADSPASAVQVILAGDGKTAFRDPAAYYHDGTFYVYYTYNTRGEDGLTYWQTAWSKSSDLVTWTAPKPITPRDRIRNFSSPGNVVRVGDEFLLCLQTYPTPTIPPPVQGRGGVAVQYGDATCRVWIMRSRNLEDWGDPEMLRVEGTQVPDWKMARVIDPFLLRDKEDPAKWWCFYKKGGKVCYSWSVDLKTWTPAGVGAGGENPCVIVDGGEYVLFYAPHTGVGVKRSRDLKTWRDEGVLDLPRLDWTVGRLTGGFVLDLRHEPRVGRALLFFHGSQWPERDPRGGWSTHCNIGLLSSTDLRQWTVPGATSFQPGAIWKDDKGVHINAHSAGMLYHEGTYWWFGEHKIAGSAGNIAHVGVHVYSSRDLYNWKDEGIALKVSETPGHDLFKGCVIERPKVIFNRKTGKFVMWFHYEKDSKYSTASAGVAVSDAPAGPYRFVGLVRPNAKIRPRNGNDALMVPLSDGERQRGKPQAGCSREQEADYYFRLDMERGHDVRDQTLYVDDDGVAYQIHSAERNRTLHVSRLTDDYLKPAGDFTRVLVGKLYEAPAIVKRSGKYWLFGSHCSGWAPNPGRLAVADSIWGPYTEMGNPWKGPEHDLAVSYDSQSTFVLPVAGKPGAFIYMADRWRPNNAIDGRYIWLPVKWSDGRPVLEWQDEWDLTVLGNR